MEKTYTISLSLEEMKMILTGLELKMKDEARKDNKYEESGDFRTSFVWLEEGRRTDQLHDKIFFAIEK